jgi:tetratricopeptide (TPR) repeat protein
MRRRTAPPNSRRGLLSSAGLLAGLALLPLAAYSGGSHSALFFDSMQLEEDPALADLSAASRRFWSTFWWPGQQLSEVTFALNAEVNTWIGLPRMDGRSFFAVNLCCHIVNGWLVYILPGSLARRSRGGVSVGAATRFAAAALFALHPLHVASIDYALQRRGLMSTTFYLAGLLAWLRLRSAGRRGEQVAWASAVAACFFFSVKSKTMGLTFPFAVMALEYARVAADPRALRRWLAWTLPAAVICTAGLFGYLHGAGLFDLRTMSFSGRAARGLSGAWAHFLAESQAFVHYWKLILLPLPRWLCVDHAFAPPRGFWSPGVLASLVLHGILLAGALAAARRGRLLLSFGVCLFYVSLIPWVLLPQAELLVEYKTYLGSVGAVLAMVELARPRRWPPRLGAAMAIGGGALLFAITFPRNQLFCDPVALWQDAARKYPAHDRAHINHGTSLFAAGRHEEAVEAYARALALSPGNARLHLAQSKAERAGGRMEEALRSARRARELNGDDLEIRVRLAELLALRGRVEEAMAELRDGLGRAGAYGVPAVVAEARFYLGNTLRAKGRLLEAAAEFEAALGLDPGAWEAHYALGLTLAERGQFGRAISHYRQALALRPASAPIERALADAQARLAERGR